MKFCDSEYVFVAAAFEDKELGDWNHRRLDNKTCVNTYLDVKIYCCNCLCDNPIVNPRSHFSQHLINTTVQLSQRCWKSNNDTFRDALWLKCLTAFRCLLPGVWVHGPRPDGTAGVGPLPVFPRARPQLHAPANGGPGLLPQEQLPAQGHQMLQHTAKQQVSDLTLSFNVDVSRLVDRKW